VFREPLPFLRVFVKEIRVTGSTVFSPDDLAKVTAPYTNREITSEDLESLRQALTLHYVNRGYFTSGAVVPDQTVAEGVLRVEIIEGKLIRIEVEGNKWFRSFYFRNRIALGADPPVNVNRLQERLQLLQADARIERINAELRPGVARGESVLNVRVAERSPFKAWLEFNNYQAPAVGSYQGLATVAHQNVLGLGDTLSVQYGQSEGIIPNLNVRYAVPVTAYDTTVSFDYRKLDFKVIEGQFEALDIESKFNIYGLGVRQPLFRTVNQELALSLVGNYEVNNSSLLGAPFDFTPGTTGGQAIVSVLRFGQEYVHRTGQQVISAISRFSFGLPVMGATINSSSALASGEFFSWLGQAQYARQLPQSRVQFLARTDMQFTNHHLFLVEQIAVGGRYSVRGYREFTLVRDNAFMASGEIRLPVYTSSLGADLVHLVPFVDYGRSWNTGVSTPDPEWLASVGVGLTWSFWRGSRFEVYWGQRLNHVQNPKDNLQDYGVHVGLVVEAF
jgi:hemolysin activation/secretion protein